MIDLEPRHIEVVKSILARHVADCEVRAYGSRVTGKSKKYSDLDIMLLGDAKIDWRRIEALKDAFSESDLPFMVDVMDGNAISESFREIVDKNYEVIQERHSGRG